MDEPRRSEAEWKVSSLFVINNIRSSRRAIISATVKMKINEFLLISSFIFQTKFYKTNFMKKKLCDLRKPHECIFWIFIIIDLFNVGCYL